MNIRADFGRGWSLVIFVWLLFPFSWGLHDSQKLETLVTQIGGTFCKYLVYRSQINRRYMRECGDPACNWNDWQDALNNSVAQPSHPHVNSSSYSRQRIVLSYAHNGFGNQLWEHSVAFMVAESLKARLLIAVVPDSLSPGGYLPPNTWTGMGAMEKLLPKEFIFENLPENSSLRSLCENEPFYVSDRPIDWKSRNYSTSFKNNLYELLVDPQPRCLKLLGYFQNLPLCADDARRLWTNRLLHNVTMSPGPNDISVYLRCVPRHYHFNHKEFYEAILNNTKYDRIWLFQAPECPTKLGGDRNKDGPVAGVVRLLMENYNATRWPQYPGTDDNLALLHDLTGLISSKKLILPLSSWAFWAGFLSSADEVHVNAPPLHPLVESDRINQYIYHNEKAKLFFGRFNRTAYDIFYRIDLNSKHYVYNNININNNTEGTNSSSDLSNGRRLRLSDHTFTSSNISSNMRDDYLEYLTQLTRVRHLMI